MKKLNCSGKNLKIFEADFIFFKRRNITYSYESDEIYNSLVENLTADDDIEFEAICKDLRCFRNIKNYELKEITISEYELCVDEFQNNQDLC